MVVGPAPRRGAHSGLWPSVQRPQPPSRLYRYSKGIARISSKNQITIPIAALEEAGLHPGEAVTVEPAGDGELRVRRAALTFDAAFGALTGVYPPGYLDQLDAEDAER